jgi:hypothetical protein
MSFIFLYPEILIIGCCHDNLYLLFASHCPFEGMAISKRDQEFNIVYRCSKKFDEDTLIIVNSVL